MGAVCWGELYKTGLACPEAVCLPCAEVILSSLCKKEPSLKNKPEYLLCFTSQQVSMPQWAPALGHALFCRGEGS